MKIINRLLQKLRLQKNASTWCANIAPTARIYEGGKIENIFNDPLRIVVGENTHIRGRLLTFAVGGQINIGEWCYVGHNSEIWSMNHISIGDRVLIAHNVNIVDTSAHSHDPKERHENYKILVTHGQPSDPLKWTGVTSLPITIEDDVWISFGVTILKGVTIGKGSVIAAGSFVTKDVPPGMMYRNSVTPIMTPLTHKDLEK